MEKQNFILPEGISQAQVNKWKADYGDIIGVTVEANGKKMVAIFRAMDFDLMSAFMAKEKKSEEIAGIKLIYNTCKLYADEAIEKNDMYKLNAVKGFMATFQNALNSFENL